MTLSNNFYLSLFCHLAPYTLSHHTHFSLDRDGDELEFGGAGGLADGAERPATRAPYDVRFTFLLGPASKKRKRMDGTSLLIKI